ncbi:MAG: cell division protein FtsQ/DivIB [Dichotomicrobium sp.]
MMRRTGGRGRRAGHAVRTERSAANARTLWAWLDARAEAASRLGACLSAMLLVAVAIYGAALGGQLATWQATVAARLETALIAGGFGINEIVVKGREHLEGARIEEALDASRARTIFSFDTRAAKARLEEIGWVKSARVMRLWPSTLVVELREREPFARWDIRGHTLLIDRDGELLGPVTPAFADMPRVAGEGADAAAAALFETLNRHAGVDRHVALARRIERRRWDLVLEDGRRIQLPAQGLGAALPVAARLLAGALPDGVTAIDLRVPGRIALRRGTPEEGQPGPTAQLSGRLGDARRQPL